MKYAREDLAVVHKVFCGHEDHGLLTCVVHLRGRDGGWAQGFGNLVLDEVTLPVFRQRVCAVFGTTDFESLAGRPCVALYAFNGWNQPIEGLRGPCGDFTLTDFRRSLNPQAPSAVEVRRQELSDRVRTLERSVREAYDALEAFEAEVARG